MLSCLISCWFGGCSLVHGRAEGDTLDDWVRAIYDIYREVDDSRDSFELWLEVLDESSKMTEDIRKHDLEKAMRHCIKTFGWVSSFVGRCLYPSEGTEIDSTSEYLRRRWDEGDFIGGQESYQKWVLLKYPEICHKCHENPCHCSPYRVIMENREKFRTELEEIQQEREGKVEKIKERIRENPQGFVQRPIDELFEMFYAIYGGSHYESELWKLAAHLMEEIGEVSKKLVDLNQVSRMLESGTPVRSVKKDALERIVIEEDLTKKFVEMADDELSDYLRSRLGEGLKSELADVFSWITAVWNKIGLLQHPPEEAGRQPASFAAGLASHYQTPSKEMGCPVCGRARCKERCLSTNMIFRVLKEQEKESVIS